MTVFGTYVNGMVILDSRVALPESARVEVHVRLISHATSAVPPKPNDDGMDAIYEILSHRYDSGDPYGSERHNEHQP